MKLGRAYVELKGGCIYIYLDNKWPPEMPPIVKACHGRARELFDFFREHGNGHVEVGAVEIPASCVHAAVALAVMLYVAEFNKNTAYELCEESPEAVKALIADAARWSRSKSGPLINPRYYRKLAVALKEVVEAWRESKALTLEDYA
jgi:hypothetical protein